MAIDRTQALDALQPYIERARQFSGWSFEGVQSRLLGPPQPWDYEALARDHLSRAASAVDLGTGGGELLARIVEPAFARVVATEEWVVNAPIAARRLAPLGVPVLRADSLRLPFRAESFDLVLSRHEAIDPGEIARVLAPRGTFITQQVARTNGQELKRFFPDRTVWPDHFRQYQQALRGVGFRVEGREHERQECYATLGDLVFMLLVAPWDIPGFDPARDIDRLLATEAALRTADGIVLTHGRYLIVASKPT